MLHIRFGKIKDVIYNTSLFFKNQYDPKWMEDEEVQNMIADIDKSKVLSSHAIDSPVMGIIPPTSLSGGVKTLILIKEMPEKLFNASNCGDNCAEWLLKIGEAQDVTVNLRHIMDFRFLELSLSLNCVLLLSNMAYLIENSGLVSEYGKAF